MFANVYAEFCDHAGLPAFSCRLCDGAARERGASVVETVKHRMGCTVVTARTERGRESLIVRGEFRTPKGVYTEATSRDTRVILHKHE